MSAPATRTPSTPAPAPPPAPPPASSDPQPTPTVEKSSRRPARPSATSPPLDPLLTSHPVDPLATDPLLVGPLPEPIPLRPLPRYSDRGWGPWRSIKNCVKHVHRAIIIIYDKAKTSKENKRTVKQRVQEMLESDIKTLPDAILHLDRIVDDAEGMELPEDFVYKKLISKSWGYLMARQEVDWVLVIKGVRRLRSREASEA